jgi:hypothetical protein
MEDGNADPGGDTQEQDRSDAVGMAETGSLAAKGTAQDALVGRGW